MDEIWGAVEHHRQSNNNGVYLLFLFTPMGIVMRLFRRDELRLKIKARQTHWKSKSNQSGDSDAFKNQF